MKTLKWTFLSLLVAAVGFWGITQTKVLNSGGVVKNTHKESFKTKVNFKINSKKKTSLALKKNKVKKPRKIRARKRQNFGKVDLAINLGPVLDQDVEPGDHNNIERVFVSHGVPFRGNLHKVLTLRKGRKVRIKFLEENFVGVVVEKSKQGDEYNAIHKVTLQSAKNFVSKVNLTFTDDFVTGDIHTGRKKYLFQANGDLGYMLSVDEYGRLQQVYSYDFEPNKTQI